MSTTLAVTAATTARTERLSGLWSRSLPVIMGVLNCTQDSFSDGGAHLDPQSALVHAEALVNQGASVVDVGGESTRPGAQDITADQERGRVVPVISELRRRRPHTLISVDTSKAAVAAAALDAGADVINDVTAASDPRMLELAAEHRAAIILMHMRGTPRTMQRDTTYSHVVAEVHHYLRARARAAESAGVSPDLVWLDPGIGFGKDDEGNLALLAALPELASLGHPVVIGPSRKSFIGRVTGAPVNDRLPGTLAALVPAVSIARVVVRVHDPGPASQFLQIARGLQEVAG